MTAATHQLQAPSSRALLGPIPSFLLLASITISMLAGSAAPTPLYPVYQAQWGFSAITTTVVFGIYAIAVLASLLVAGRLSDHVGRRPVLVATLAVQVVVMAIFATAHGVTALIVARVLQGLATGVAVTAVGAGMLDIDSRHGTTANAVAPALGTATGGLVAGLLVHYLPAPTLLVYAVLGVVFVAQAAGVLLMRETTAPRPGAWSSLRPRFALPHASRRPFLLAVPALVAPWALAGFYASLGPALMRTEFQLDSSLAGGVALFVLAASGALAVFVTRAWESHRLMSTGTFMLSVGVAIVVVALGVHSVPAYFAGTAVAGLGFGAAFQGAVRTVLTPAPAATRAGVLSVVFVVAYLAMGLPAVVAGALVALQGALATTAREFGLVVLLLSVVAFVGTRIRRR